MLEKQDIPPLGCKFTTCDTFFPWLVLPGTWNMQYANKTNSTEPVSLAGHTYAEHYRKRSFFSNTSSKITPIIQCSYRLLQKQDRKKSHCSMYTKSKDFSTVCKEIKQTDLKTNLWFRSSIQCIIKLGWKVQNDVRLIISTATVSTEISAVIWVKIRKENYVFSLSEQADYHPEISGS